MEWPGAVYHVINRGNYRRWVFEGEGAKEAMVTCLKEAAERCRWVVHAYVVMGNHFHLAVETPEGNLGAGMHWLQTTFATRFNRLHGERGHLFQGRYKALPLEPGAHLGAVCHYIHLNPVRAGAVEVDALAGYRAGSYAWMWRPEERPPWLRAATALEAAGGLRDDPAGWQAYARYLAWQLEHGPAGRGKAYESMSRGWALGSEEFKRGLLATLGEMEGAKRWEQEGREAFRLARWEAAWRQAIQMIPAEEQAAPSKPIPAWKGRVAAQIKATSDAPNAWIAERLGLSSAAMASKLAGLAVKSEG